MSGFVVAMGPCLACGQFFSFNPHLVPSLMWNGAKEPICQTCMEASNKKREAAGKPPHVIRPGAYEPLPESEL
jgi:hypothetical protein